jgi:propionyl-CoA carboxylase alpha chain
MSGAHLAPPRNGEGDRAKHGGGGPDSDAAERRAPSTTPLRVAIPLLVPGRS